MSTACKPSPAINTGYPALSSTRLQRRCATSLSSATRTAGGVVVPPSCISGMPELQCIRVFRGEWDREVEGRAVADGAFHPDLAPVHLHDLLNDREAEASPGDRLGGAAADPTEALEYVADLVLRYTQTGIRDADQDVTFLGPAGQRDGPAFGRVLDGVVDDVAHDLDQAVAVAGDNGQPGIEVRLELHGERARGRPRDRLHQHVVDVDVGRPHRHPPRFHAVQFGHVSDQAVHAVRVIEYVAAIGAHLVRLEPAVADQLAESLDAGQRGAELVADDAQELALGAVQLLEVGVGVALRVQRLGQAIGGFAHRGDVLDHHEHVLGGAGRVWNRGRRQLQPEPAARSGRGAYLKAASIGDAGEEGRLLRARGGLVV